MRPGIPVYFRDDSTHEFRAMVPHRPEQIICAASLPDLRRKLLAMERAEDPQAAATELTPSERVWDQPYDPNAETMILPPGL